jgi:hypothetical protein
MPTTRLAHPTLDALTREPDPEKRQMAREIKRLRELVQMAFQEGRASDGRVEWEESDAYDQLTS